MSVRWATLAAESLGSSGGRGGCPSQSDACGGPTADYVSCERVTGTTHSQIGRASCRERV